MSDHQNHEWRADGYTLVRGDLLATVSRAWCSDDKCSTAWRWSLYSTSTCDTIEPPKSEKQYGFPTHEAAQQAAEAFMASLDDVEQYRRAASFVGVPVPGEGVPL